MPAQQTLVVTGASRGLGGHIAKRAVESGYKVIGLSRTGEAPEGVTGIACDVTSETDIAKACETIRKEENLYGLINAAGVAAMNLLMTTPASTVRKVIGINLIGSILCCSAISKLMARQKNGRIILFSTIAVPLAIKGESVYAASKAGVETFTRAFAREMSDFNITVNCIAPGPIETDLIRGLARASIDDLVRFQLNPTMAVPEDVWNIANLILQPTSNKITGDTFHVGGA
jgi:3-oxoacyl-[acyl-carrier protein] reductase